MIKCGWGCWNKYREVSFCFLRAPCGEEKGGESEDGKEEQKACSIILIPGCVWVTFGGMIVSHLGVWGVIFPPVWSHSPDLCKLAVKHIATRPSCLTHGLSIHTSRATAPSQVFRHLDTHTYIQYGHIHTCFLIGAHGSRFPHSILIKSITAMLIQTIFSSFGMKKMKKSVIWFCTYVIFFWSHTLYAHILVTEWFICICVPSKEKKKRKKTHNKIVHCADHLFLAWLMSGRAEWQWGDFSIRLMRGELKPTAWGLQHHYRRKKVWIHLAWPRF